MYMYSAWEKHYIPETPKAPQPKPPKPPKPEKPPKPPKTKPEKKKSSMWSRKSKRTEKADEKVDGNVVETPVNTAVEKADEKTDEKAGERKEESESEQEQLESNPSDHEDAEDPDRTPRLSRQQTLTESVISEDLTEYAPSVVESDYEQQQEPRSRVQSLLVTYTEGDIQRMAREIYEGTIPEVHLSLFGYWINQKPENFEIAKASVRELSLDHGYNTARITNEHLRKLLEDTRDSRPRYVSGTRVLQGLEEEDFRNGCRLSGSVKARVDFSAYLLASGAKVKTWLEVVTDDKSNSEPNYVATNDWKKKTKEATSTVLVVEHSSTGTAKDGQTLIIGTQQSGTNSSPVLNYPPNTPDRPAPLSLRSRGSKPGETAVLLRSVSTPVVGNNASKIPLELPRNSHIFRETESHPLLTPRQATYSNCSPDDDVFGITKDDKSEGQHTPTAAKGSFDVKKATLNRRSVSMDIDPPASGLLSAFHSEFDRVHGVADDKASSHGFSAFSQLSDMDDMHNDLLRYSPTIKGDKHDAISIDASSGVLGSYEQHHLPNFLYGPPAGPPPAVPLPGLPKEVLVPNLEPAPKGRPNKSKHKRSKITVPNPMPITPDFHRPLPLRSYESEAHLYPTSRAQGSSAHNRANSAGSMALDSRPASIAMEPAPAIPPMHPMRAQLMRGRSPSLSSQLFPEDSRSQAGRDQDRFANGNAHASLQLDTTAGDERSIASLGTTSLFAAFPLPPATSDDPIGEISLLVSHAASPSQSSNDRSALVQAYRNITKIRIQNLLYKTRAQGAQLDIVDRDTMSLYEKIWRHANEPVLVSVFGDSEVFLDDHAIECIHCIARDLRTAGPASWLIQIFETAVDN